MLRKSTKRARSKRTDKSTNLVQVPGTLVTDDLCSASFRYVCSSAGSQAFARADMLNLLGLASSTTNLYRVIGSCRVRRIHLWSGTATTGAGATSTFQWNGAYSKPSVRVSTTMGVAGVSYQTERPPTKSLAADWSVAGSNEAEFLFTVGYNSGDVFQIDVTYMLQNAVEARYTASSITVPGATLTVGYLYSVDLDHASGSAKFVSVGRLSTV